MSNKTDKTQKIKTNQLSFGHHGQTSVILQQIRYYFLYKGILSAEKEQALLKVVCCNIKHFIMISKNQEFLAYEKNTYHYYQERIIKQESCKKLFLDLLACQSLLTNEYEKSLTKANCEWKNVAMQMLEESRECENIIKKQI